MGLWKWVLYRVQGRYKIQFHALGVGQEVIQGIRQEIY